MTLAVLATHPIQYHAPVYRAVQQQYHIPVTVVYGSDFSVAGYRDEGFGVSFAWDIDLLSGYDSVFLARVAEGGVQGAWDVSGRGLSDALQQIKPQAVLLTGYALPFHREAVRQTAGLGCPLFFRAEVTDHARARHPLKRFGRDLILRRLYRRFARLLYIGQRAREHYRRLGCAEEHLIFSPYCVDTIPFQVDEAARQTWRTVTRRALNITDGQWVIAFVGKLIGVKAPELLLAAVKQLPNTLRRQAVILWVGDGELRPALEAAAQAEPVVAGRFVGFQNQTALSRYYHAADVLVLPSVADETWGLVVNEALHHGVPCAVSDGVGCAPDLIVPGVSGEVFESGSVPALVAALQKLHACREQVKVREACRNQVAAYSVTAAAGGIAQAYREVVEG